ncbi:hypothetical protein JCM10212_005258 [Sporobolomyces blumeae]
MERLARRRQYVPSVRLPKEDHEGACRVSRNINLKQFEKPAFRRLIAHRYSHLFQHADVNPRFGPEEQAHLDDFLVYLSTLPNVVSIHLSEETLLQTAASWDGDSEDFVIGGIAESAEVDALRLILGRVTSLELSSLYDEGQLVAVLEETNASLSSLTLTDVNFPARTQTTGQHRDLFNHLRELRELRALEMNHCSEVAPLLLRYSKSRPWPITHLALRRLGRRWYNDEKNLVKSFRETLVSLEVAASEDVVRPPLSETAGDPDGNTMEQDPLFGPLPQLRTLKAFGFTWRFCLENPARLPALRHVVIGSSIELDNPNDGPDLRGWLDFSDRWPQLSTFELISRGDRHSLDDMTLFARTGSFSSARGTGDLDLGSTPDGAIDPSNDRKRHVDCQAGKVIKLMAHVGAWVSVALKRTDVGAIDELVRALGPIQELIELERDWRSLYRHVRLGSPVTAAKFLRALVRSPQQVGNHVRTLHVTLGAFRDPRVFSDLNQDDVVRHTPNLVELDSALAMFAPLPDGRQTHVAYPPTLESVRFAPTFEMWMTWQEITDTDQFGGVDAEGMTEDEIDLLESLFATHSQFYRALPRLVRRYDLRNLTIPHSHSIAPDPATSCLESLAFDFVHGLSVDILSDFAAGAAKTLRSLKTWCCHGITDGALADWLKQHGAGLTEFAFKPSRSTLTGAFPANVFVDHLPNVARLTLGESAADHNIWRRLPRSMTHLCVALPTIHSSARLSLVSEQIRTRLDRLVVLELYFGVYRPRVEVDYPPTNPDDPSALREVRFCEIDDRVDGFLLDLGTTLYALTVNDVRPGTAPILNTCPRLRRLEVEGSSTRAELPKLLTSYNSPFLHTFRFDLSLPPSVDDVIDIVSYTRFDGRGLRSLELVGTLPVDANAALDDPPGWSSPRTVDRLLETTKAYGTTLTVNGRLVSSTGDLCVALLEVEERLL